MTFAPIIADMEGELGFNPRAYLHITTAPSSGTVVKETSPQTSRKGTTAVEPCKKSKKSGMGQDEGTSNEPFPDFWNQQTSREQEQALKADDEAKDMEWEMVDEDEGDPGWIRV